MREKIDDASMALSEFELGALAHTHALETGDYRTANKAYKQIVNAIDYLKEHNQILLLMNMLDNSSVGVQSWEACYLLPVREMEALSALEKIAQRHDIQGFSAQTTLSEWRKGNLKF